MSAPTLSARPLVPRALPCAHDRDRVPHTSLAQLLACIEKHGNPGFSAEPEALS